MPYFCCKTFACVQGHACTAWCMVSHSLVLQIWLSNQDTITLKGSVPLSHPLSFISSLLDLRSPMLPSCNSCFGRGLLEQLFYFCRLNLNRQICYLTVKYILKLPYLMRNQLSVFKISIWGHFSMVIELSFVTSTVHS